MCLDIEIREKSNGQKGILQLMQDLSNEYGTKKAFKDDELFAKITELTYPSVGAFLNKYVAGETPIPYADYFAKMGVTQAKVEANGNPFLVGGNQPIISYNPETKEFFYLPEIEINAFMKELGLKNNDVILEINGVKQDLTTINQTIGESFGWKDGDAITMKIKRDGKEMDIKGKVVIPKEIKEGYMATDDSKKALREAWLKG
jgi:predicted metalloprotease with PDZ domain